MATATARTTTTNEVESGRYGGDKRIRIRTLSSSPSFLSNDIPNPTFPLLLVPRRRRRRRVVVMILLLTAASGCCTSSSIGSSMRRAAWISVTTTTSALLHRQHSSVVAFVGGSSLRWRTTPQRQQQQERRRLGIISTAAARTEQCQLMAAQTKNNKGENHHLSERRNFSSRVNIVRPPPPKRATSRIIPPSYDALLEEDEGFGGYDYVPDIYDMQENYTSWQDDENGIMKDDYADATLMQQPQQDEFFVARPPKTIPVTTRTSELPKNKKQQSHQSSLSSLSSPSVVVNGGAERAKPNPAIDSTITDYRLPSIFDMMSSPVTADDDDEDNGNDSNNFDDVMSSSTWEDETPVIDERVSLKKKMDFDGDGLEKEPNPTSKSTNLKTTTTKRSAPTPPASPNWNDNDMERSNFLRKASTGLGASTDLEVAQERLKKITGQIYQENNGKEFNIQSPRQVAKVLFGSAGGSTNKEVLEGMAAGGGNRMADLILQYRTTLAEIQRQQRRIATQDKRVRSASAVIRPAIPITTDTALRTNNTIANNTSASSNINSTAAAVVMEELDTDPLILVDASAYIFRAYYSMPPIHRSDGMPTGAVLGFCNMLNRLVVNRALRGEQARLVLVFDPSKGTTFRHELYSEYKGHRPSVPVDLIPQFPLIRHAAVAYGICQLEAPSFEADDVIATLATMALKEGIDANILSSDKDLMQLVTDKDVVPSIHMIEPMTMARVTYDDVVDKWGVPPKQLGDLLALAGDVSDNVPGVPGIGPKIAAMLLDEFSTLDNLLDNVENVKQKTRREKLQQHADMARLSRKLVDLERNVPLDAMTFPHGVETVADLRMDKFNPDRILAFYDQMGFRDLKRRFLNQLQRGQRPSASSSSSFFPRSKSSYGKKEKTEIPKPEDYADVPF